MLEAAPLRWVHTPLPRGSVNALADALAISPVLAELLLRAGLEDPPTARRFLQPRLAELGDPFVISHLEVAVRRLRQAIDREESIVILGDYDVDGVTSTALLVSILREFGVAPRFIVPLRLEEGYGLSRQAIDRALEQGRPDLFIALDCGTNALEEVAYLRSRGVDVIIVDHHRSKEEIPPEAILINPHVFDAEGSPPWLHLCTVGLVFKVVHGLLKDLRTVNHPAAFRIRLRDYLDLVALGTVADLVPLLQENRILARHGLAILEQSRRPGLVSLMEVSGINRGAPLRPVDVSFRLGPRINASGRLADASVSVELMLSEDVAFCRQAARQLDEFNRERQEIERAIAEDAERQVSERFADLPGIVLFDEQWHPGVVGIVASRVSRKFHRPCVVLGNEGALAKGSGRTVFGLDLVEALAECGDLLQSWGGHPMAVGVAIEKPCIEDFRVRFAEVIGRRLREAPAHRTLEVSTWVELDDIDEHLMGELDLLHPFGQGNPEPVLGVRGVVFRRPVEVFKEQHYRFQLDDSDGRRLFGVAWKLADRLPPVGEPVDLAFELVWNHFNGRRLLQMELLDWRPAAG
jgi:single-stranded-DNA-specific exonuclease